MNKFLSVVVIAVALMFAVVTVVPLDTAKACWGWGDKGDRGSRGAKGNKGDKGDKGDRGPRGKDGKDGRNGINGINGKDGANGRNGRDYTGPADQSDPQRTYSGWTLSDVEWEGPCNTPFERATNNNCKGMPYKGLIIE